MFRKVRMIFMVLVLVLVCATAVCFADDTTTVETPVVIEQNIVENEVLSGEDTIGDEVFPAAIVNPEIAPQYNISMDIETTFEAGTGIAQCGVTVDTNPGTATTVNMRIVLERLTTNGYVVVKTWRDQVRTFDSYGIADIYREFALTERGTYRFRASGTVYKGSTVVATYTDVTSPTDPY